MKGTGELPSYDNRLDFITEDSVDSLVVDKAPDFVDYLFFHNVIDKFCFAAKAHYASRDIVKRRKYRLDTLFQSYLIANGVSLDTAPLAAPSPDLRERIEHHLGKAWHNELVRSDPLLPDYLTIGVQLSNWKGPGTGGLAAWNVVQSYYAVFEFFSAVAAVYSPLLKVDGHKKLSKTFNSQVLGKAKNEILFYPFNLSSRTSTSTLTHPMHCKFHYSSYPREPGMLVSDIDFELVKAFQLIGKKGTASVLDLLYEFRLWANYTGVNTILRLNDGGYLGFLMKNLATLVFLAGGIAELTALRALGETAYLKILRRFQDDFINRNERFARNKILVPAHVRLRCFSHLGLVKKNIRFIMPELDDPIQFLPANS